MLINLWDAFDRIYVINLPTRADRRREMEPQLCRVGLSLAGPKVRLFEAVRPADVGAFPSVGARGCFLSHLGVLRRAHQSGERTILILEDDVNFAPDIQALASGLAPQLAAQDWGMFYGGHRGLETSQGSGCLQVAPSDAIETTHFVAFRGHQLIGDAAAYLERQLQRPPGHPEGGPMHVDGSYSWFRREHPQCTTLAAVPPLAYQRTSRSDIHAGSRIARMWGAGRMLDAARRLRNRFA